MSLHEILEKDEAGNVTATYLGVDKGSRVDIVVCIISSLPFFSRMLNRVLVPPLLCSPSFGFILDFESFLANEKCVLCGI